MTTTAFQALLKSIRESSRWPEIPDFADQVGLSLGGLRKYESGERLPTPEKLEQIIKRGHIVGGYADQLRALRDEDKLSRVALSSGQVLIGEQTPTDTEKLLSRLISEILYVLKQSGVRVTAKTQRVLQKRVAIILNATLGDQ